MLIEYDSIIKENQNAAFKMNFYVEYDDFIREFRHLVYAFDKDIPLNAEINRERAMEIPLPYLHGEDEFKERAEKVRKYIEFFIHYITEYCD
ncbi:MAG: hypothetical protein IJ892_11130 [Prevotella sp.]|nr:hypothetical protein [Prevotella sp.]